MKKLLILLCTLPLASYGAIEDNSFLLEEAFNQEWGVYQFIQKYQTADNADGYAYTFENEIPITDKTHQFSYELTYARPEASAASALNDVGLNYRFQPYNKNGVILADRVGLVVPTGRVNKDAGNGVIGFEFMQSASIQLNDDFITHFNFGFSVLPHAKSNGIRQRRTQTGFSAGQSLIYLWKDNVNFMFEALMESGQVTNDDGSKTPETAVTLNPGMRFALDLDWKDTQIVPGISFPTEILNGPTEHGVLVYLSIEPKFY